MRIAIRTAVLAAAVLSLLGFADAQEQPPAKPVPLGDVVKRPKPVQKAKKVVTDDDIPPRAPEPAPAPSAAAPATASEAAAPDDKSASKPPQPVDREKKIADLKAAAESEKRIIKRFEEALADPNLSDNRRLAYEETLRVSREQLERITAEREKLEGSAPEAKPTPATPPPPQS